MFAECPADTIDYAVMERITGSNGDSPRRAVVVPMDAEWSDLGSWAAIMDISDKDANGNVVKGDVYNPRDAQLNDPRTASPGVRRGTGGRDSRRDGGRGSGSGQEQGAGREGGGGQSQAG